MWGYLGGMLLFGVVALLVYLALFVQFDDYDVTRKRSDE